MCEFLRVDNGCKRNSYTFKPTPLAFDVVDRPPQQRANHRRRRLPILWWDYHGMKHETHFGWSQR
jgi:hypothetical protein